MNEYTIIDGNGNSRKIPPEEVYHTEKTCPLCKCPHGAPEQHTKLIELIKECKEVNDFYARFGNRPGGAVVKIWDRGKRARELKPKLDEMIKRIEDKEK